jgi:hypothetical protein
MDQRKMALAITDPTPAHLSIIIAAAMAGLIDSMLLLGGKL